MKLKEIRKSKGLTQEALAKAAGVGTQTIFRIEEGKNGYHAHKVVLRAIAAALGVAVEDIEV